MIMKINSDLNNYQNEIFMLLCYLSYIESDNK